MTAQPMIPGVMELKVENVQVAEIDVYPPRRLPLKPILIVDPNSPFEVWAEVTLDGHLISLFSESGWTIEYYGERMGGGADLRFGPKAGNWPPIGPRETHAALGKDETKVVVPAGTEPGLYKLTCVFKSDRSDFILGFDEGGMFQVAKS